MKNLVEFPLEEGGTIVLETDLGEPEGAVLRSLSPGEIAAKSTQTFESALERIKPAAAAIIGKLRELSEPPDEAGVEFGLNMSAEAGAVVASASVEAHYKVTLLWKRKQGASNNPR